MLKKFVDIFCISILLFASITACAQKSKVIEKYKTEAALLFKSEKYENAMEKYQLALDVDETCEECKQQINKCLTEIKKNKKPLNESANKITANANDNRIINNRKNFFRIWNFNNRYAWAMKKNNKLCIINKFFDIKKVADVLVISSWTKYGDWVCIDSGGRYMLFNAAYVNKNGKYSLFYLNEIILFKSSYFRKLLKKWYLFNNKNEAISIGFDFVDSGNLANTYSSCTDKNDDIVHDVGDPQFAVVNIGNSQGVIDSAGYYLIKPDYRKINLNNWLTLINDDYSEDTMHIITAMKLEKLKEKWGVFDRKGLLLFPCEYDNIECSNGNCLMKKNDEYQYIKINGSLLNSIKYQYAEPFRDGKAKVTLKNETFYIDKNGNRIQ